MRLKIQFVLISFIIFFAFFANPLKASENLNENFNYKVSKTPINPPPSCMFSDVEFKLLTYPLNGADTSSNMSIGLRIRRFPGSLSGISIKYSIDNGQTWNIQPYAGTLHDDTIHITGLNMSIAGKYKIIFGVVGCPSKEFITSVFISDGPLSGSYDVGITPQADFDNFEQAITTLESVGVSANVVLNLASGKYPNKYIIHNIPGTSHQNTVTIQSKSGINDVVFNASTVSFQKNYILKLYDTKHIIIRNITFTPYHGFFSKVLEIDSGSTDIRITKSRFVTTSNGPANLFIDATANFNYRNIQIDSNNFNGSNYAIGLSSISSNYQLINARIFDNILTNFASNGISAGNVDTLIVRGNHLQSYNSCSGLNIGNHYNSILVEKNNISVDNTAFSISGNYSIATNDCWIVNNMFSSSYTGVSLSYNSKTNFYYNTVVLIGQYTSTNSKCIYVSSNNGTNIRNNNLINNIGGYAIYVPSNAITSIDTINYNNFYTNGNNIARWDTAIASLASLQLVSGKNTNTLSSACYFSSTTDFHVNTQAIDNGGIPLSGISTDYDGQIRSTTAPDIGCDEFTFAYNDGGLQNISLLNCTASGIPLSVDLKNTGLILITTALINWSVDNVLQTPKSWSGSLAAGGSTNISIGNFIPLQSKSKIIAYLSSINSISDSNSYNDTSFYKMNGSIYSGNYTVGADSTADFQTIMSAISLITNNGICGNVNLNILPGTYNEYISIGQIPGIGPNARLTIQSALHDSSTVLLTMHPLPGSTYSIDLDSASYIIIKDLSFSDTKVKIDNSHSIKISRCNFTEYPYAPYYSVNFMITDTDSININHCSIGRSVEAFYFHCCDSILFSNNSVLDYNIDGIRLESCYYPTISGNTFKNNSLYTNNSVNFTNTAIILNIFNHAKIDKNRIILHAKHRCVGMGFTVAYNTTNDLTISNNMISSFGSNGVGISLAYTNNAKIYHNAIYTPHTCLSFYQGNATIKNNVFYSTGSPLSGYSTDYNLLYNNEQYLINRYGNYTTLSAYQTATNSNPHSVSFDPLFESISDLHISNTALLNTGTYISAAGSDFDGIIRNSSGVSIGPAQIGNSIYDLSLESISLPLNQCKIGNNLLTIDIKNMNLGVIDSFYVYYQLDNNSYDSTQIIQSLSFNQKKDKLPIDSIYIPAGKHWLKVWTKTVGVTDANNSNNLQRISLNATGLAQAVIELDSLNLFSINCANSLDTSIVIYNKGDSTLNILLDTSTYNGNISTSSSLKVLFIKSSVAWPSIEGYIQNAINLYVPNVVQTFVSPPDASLFESYCNYYDVIIFSPLITDYHFNSNNMHQYNYSVKKFVASGGTVIFMSSKINSSYWFFSQDYWKGSIASYPTNGNALSSYTVDYSDPLFSGITSSSPYSHSNYLFEFTEPITRISSKGPFDNIVRKEVGSGQMYILGFDLNYNNATKKKILGNAINTATKHNSILQVMLPSASVAPSDSIVIPLHFPLTGIGAGVYKQSFMFKTNSYPQSIITIPITVNVSGSPSFHVNKDSIDFGSFLVGSVNIDSIELFNSGCAPLTVIGVNTNNSNLSFTLVNATIPNNSSKFIKFSYQTNTVDTVAVNVLIHTSDTDTIIRIKGRSYSGAKVVNRMPNFQSLIQNCEDTLMIPIRLKNTGGLPLNYSLSKIVGNIKVLALDYPGSSNYTTFNVFSDIKTVIRSMPNVTLDTTLSTSISYLLNTLSNYNVLLIPTFNSISPSIYQTTAFHNLYADFVKKGGALIFMNQYSSYMFTPNSILYSTVGNSNFPNIITIVDPFTQITSGFSGAFNYNATMRNWLIPDIHPIMNHYKSSAGASTASALVFTRNYGAGHYVYLGPRYPHNAYNPINMKKIIRNTIIHASTKTDRQLSFSSTSGTIGVGDSTKVWVIINSSNIPQGLYLNKFYLNTNDITATSTLLSVGYTVSNNLNLASFLGSDTGMCSNYTVHAPTGYNYNWSNNQTEDTIAVTSTGVYSCTISKGFDCSDRDSVLITIFPITTPTISGLNSNYCTNTAIDTIILSPLGGTLISSTIAGNIINPDSLNVGLHSLKYIYTNLHGCIDSASATFNIRALPTVNIQNVDSTYCLYDTIINIFASPNGGYYNQSAFVYGTFYPAKTNGGIDTIIYYYSNSYACSSSDTAVTYIYPRVTSNVVNLSTYYCSNDLPVLLASSISGGSFSGNIISNDTLIPNFGTSGSQNIYYHFTDNNSCVMVDTFTTSIYNPPVITPNTINNPICWHQDSILLTANHQNVIFSGLGIWNNVLHPNVMNNGNYTYYFSLTDSNNCFTFDSSNVFISKPIPYMGSDTTINAYDSIVLNPGIFSYYYWSTGVQASSIVVDSLGIGLNSKTITVLVYDSANCYNTDTIIITFSNNIGISDTYMYSSDVKIFPNPTNNYLYIVDKSEDNIIHSYIIYDSMGKKVKEGVFVNNDGDSKYQISVREFSSGAYYLMLKSQMNEQKAIPFIINH